MAGLRSEAKGSLAPGPLPASKAARMIMSAETVTESTPTAAKPQPIACMEIWGGNGAVENAVSSPGLDAYIYSRPYQGDAGGGDIHYVSMCASGRIKRFVVADVAGHGDSAAALATRLRDLMRRYMNTLDQTKFTRALNEDFLKSDSGGRFATALLVTVFTPTQHVVVCNAGHPRPLMYRRAAGQWGVLAPEGEDCVDSAGGLPLGIIEPTEYSQFAVPIGAGDMVLLVTDGFVEARSPQGKMLGEDGLTGIVSRLDASRPESLLPSLISEVERYRAGQPPDDDLTAVLLYRNAAGAQDYSLREQLVGLAKMIGLARM